MRDSYFVRVHARDPQHLRQLAGFGLPVVAHSASQDEDGSVGIDGFLSLEQVAELVAEGYEVTVCSEARKEYRGRSERGTAAEWLEARKARKAMRFREGK